MATRHACMVKATVTARHGTSQVMFDGKNNNGMLKVFMDVKGPFPNKFIKKHCRCVGRCWYIHVGNAMLLLVMPGQHRMHSPTVPMPWCYHAVLYIC